MLLQGEIGKLDTKKDIYEKDNSGDDNSSINNRRNEVYLSSSTPPALDIQYLKEVSTVNTDLLVLVQRFVSENDTGRLKVYHVAKDYYEAMIAHMNVISNTSLSIRLKKDIDIVLVYIEILSNVTMEGGFDFLDEEMYQMNSIVTNGNSKNNNDQMEDSHIRYIDDESNEYDNNEKDNDVKSDKDQYNQLLHKSATIAMESTNELSNSMERDICRGMGISGAGRIKRYLNTDTEVKKYSTNSNEKKEKTSGLDLKRVNKNKNKASAASITPSESDSAHNDKNSKNNANDKSNKDNQNETQKKKRKATLSESESNRLLVLNVFKRALEANNQIKGNYLEQRNLLNSHGKEIKKDKKKM